MNRKGILWLLGTAAIAVVAIALVVEPDRDRLDLENARTEDLPSDTSGVLPVEPETSPQAGLDSPATQPTMAPADEATPPEQFLSDMKGKASDLRATLEAYRTQASQAAYETIEELEEQLNQLDSRINAASAATTSHWSATRQEIEQHYEDIARALNDTMAGDEQGQDEPLPLP